MKTETMVNMLLAIRNQIDAILNEVVTEQPCTHPTEARLNLSVLGSDKKRFKCSICGEEWEEDYPDSSGKSPLTE